MIQPYQLFHAPLSDWLWLFVFTAIIFVFITMAELGQKRFRFSSEWTRRFVHIFTGILVSVTPYIFQNPAAPFWMGILFTILNLISLKQQALEGMNKTGRKSYGTVYFPIAFVLLVFTCWHHHQSVFVLSMMIMAVADPVASIAGEMVKDPKVYQWGIDKKSVEGSVTMAGVTFVMIIAGLFWLTPIDGYSLSFFHILKIALITAIIATVLEGLSAYGSDNLTIPLGTAFVLAFYLDRSSVMQMQFTIGAGMALALAILSFRMQFLSANGAVGLFILGVIIFGAGGWIWTLPILTFFISSSLLSKIGKYQKKKLESIYEKSNQRDIVQVLANGGLAGSMVILWLYFPHPVWYFVYLGTLAAVNGDTWATELGAFSRVKPRSICTWKTVEPGTSGGITPLGTLGALQGAFVIVLVGYWMLQSQNLVLSLNSTLLIILIAGFAATLIDSVLGCTLQAQYRCPKCSKQTEKRFHCGGQFTERISGLSWMNNDMVNVFCALSSVLLVLIGIVIFL